MTVSSILCTCFSLIIHTFPITAKSLQQWTQFQYVAMHVFLFLPHLTLCTQTVMPSMDSSKSEADRLKDAMAFTAAQDNKYKP